MVAVAVVESQRLHDKRLALRDFYHGEALHAAPMFARGEKESLRQGVKLVSESNDGIDVIVCSPIGVNESRDGARDRCLRAAACKVHRDFGVRLFVIDSLGTPSENSRDLRTFRDLRRLAHGSLHRDTVAYHCRPSQEILLGLPDVVAWSYRQVLTRSDYSWFQHVQSFTEVTIL